ncbi:hypothetical protein J6590_049439 [Homalodisca vitripennis]|nr:hypothetical protein J6590_049439 [Homalodisca vitripennis]
MIKSRAKMPSRSVNFALSQYSRVRFVLPFWSQIGVKLINKLPESNKHLNNPKLFKSRLKHQLVSNAFSSVEEFMMARWIYKVLMSKAMSEALLLALSDVIGIHSKHLNSICARAEAVCAIPISQFLGEETWNCSKTPVVLGTVGCRSDVATSVAITRGRKSCPCHLSRTREVL